jgi:hypothetical protein
VKIQECVDRVLNGEPPRQVAESAVAFIYYHSPWWAKRRQQGLQEAVEAG